MNPNYLDDLRVVEGLCETARSLFYAGDKEAFRDVLASLHRYTGETLQVFDEEGGE